MVDARGEVYPRAWRVCWDHAGVGYCDDLAFGRREDARLALCALEEAGVTKKDLVALGDAEVPPEYKKIMIEALRW